MPCAPLSANATATANPKPPSAREGDRGRGSPRRTGRALGVRGVAVEGVHVPINLLLCTIETADFIRAEAVADHGTPFASARCTPSVGFAASSLAEGAFSMRTPICERHVRAWPSRPSPSGDRKRPQLKKRRRLPAGASLPLKMTANVPFADGGAHGKKAPSARGLSAYADWGSQRFERSAIAYDRNGRLHPC